MATIVKVKKPNGVTRYRVKIRLAGYPMKTATFDRLTDAKEWSARTESDLRRGRQLPSNDAERMTMADIFVRYEEFVLPKKAPSTVALQRMRLHWWSKAIGHVKLARLTPQLVIEQRDRLLKDGQSTTTVHHYLSLLRHVLSTCICEWNLIEVSPMNRVPFPKMRPPIVRYLDADERERLLAACRESGNEYLLTFVVVSLATGMRKQEVLTLKWRDIDFERGMIILSDPAKTKTRQRRGVRVAGLPLELLKQLRANRKVVTDLVFPSRKDSSKPYEVEYPFAKVLKSAGIANFRIHDLRHSCASYLAMNGASLPEIGAVLGHRSTVTTQRYAHLSDAHVGYVLLDTMRKVFGE